jgi:ABC-2 type transport system ATP-binding protein
MSAINAKGLTKTYWFYEKEAGLAGSLKSILRGKKVLVEAVRSIELDIDKGELVGFIGPNGAGKTTTLKMMSGILHPSAGELKIMGFTPSKRDKAFLKQITFISGQRNRLFWDLPAEEYFEFCRTVYEIPADVFKKRKETLTTLAEIIDILKVPQRKLSFGQRKRCELVAGLLHDPKVIFLDEPTNAMDLMNAKKIREFIRCLGEKRQHTVILTSHNMSDIEEVCDRVVVINRGKIIFDGGMDELQHTTGFNKQVRVIFGGTWSEDQLRQLGTVRTSNGQEAVIEVPAEKSAAVAAKLLEMFPVKDLSIAEPRIEAIIERLYTRQID